MGTMMLRMSRVLNLQKLDIWVLFMTKMFIEFWDSHVDFCPVIRPKKHEIKFLEIQVILQKLGRIALRRTN